MQQIENTEHCAKRCPYLNGTLCTIHIECTEPIKAILNSDEIQGYLDRMTADNIRGIMFTISQALEGESLFSEAFARQKANRMDQLYGLPSGSTISRYGIPENRIQRFVKGKGWV